jgi:hypothetical protein
MCFLGFFEGPPRVIERLHGDFMRRQMIFVPVMRGSYAVCVSGLVVHLSGDSVRVSRHITSFDHQLTLCPEF